MNIVARKPAPPPEKIRISAVKNRILCAIFSRRRRRSQINLLKIAITSPANVRSKTAGGRSFRVGMRPKRYSGKRSSATVVADAIMSKMPTSIHFPGLAINLTCMFCRPLHEVNRVAGRHERRLIECSDKRPGSKYANRVDVNTCAL